MNSVIIFLVISSMILLSHSLCSKVGSTAHLSVLALSIAFSIEDNIIRHIILVSGIVVYLISDIDSETALLFFLGIIGLLILGVAEELIIIYLSIELVSLSFYILAGRERKGMKSTEAGIKYFVLGALSSGILLMGITIVYAQTGTTDLELIDNYSRMLIVVALLFKLGAAPFHMWVPDVYEGAATIITTFFAVVPKIAYLGVLMKLGGGDPIIVAGLISIFVGSIGAINQTKIKRMLAYSAIGHIGFMLLGIGVATYSSIQATIIYMIIYIVMTINSFTIVISQGLNKIAELRGFSRRNGVLGITFGLGLMSIAGVPPLAGFYNKYLVVLSAVEHNLILYALIAILFSVISSFYYVRIIRYMFFVDLPDISVHTYKISAINALILGISSYFIITSMLYPSVVMEITMPKIY